MFENIMAKFIEERNRLVDYCTQKLIERAGLVVPINPTNFELLVLMDDLKRKDYKIKIDCGYNSRDSIYLIKIGDLEESLIAGYKFNVLTYDKKVSIVATPISLDTEDDN